MLAVLGVAILLEGLVVAYLLYEIWPAVVHATAKTPTRQRITLFDGHIKFRPSAESVLLLLVILAGALGAYIHAATAFATKLGTRRFERSWYWWYVGRLPIGSALALVVYFALRGGLVGGDATSKEVNPYGVAALAALAGLFSRQAVDKLNEVFDTFFRTRADDRETAAGELPVPDLEKIEPDSFSATQDQELTLIGRGFDDESEVMIKRAEADAPALVQTTKKVPSSDTRIVITIGANQLGAGTYEVRVINNPPGGGVSTPLEITIA